LRFDARDHLFLLDKKRTSNGNVCLPWNNFSISCLLGVTRSDFLILGSWGRHKRNFVPESSDSAMKITNELNMHVYTSTTTIIFVFAPVELFFPLGLFHAYSSLPSFQLILMAKDHFKVDKTSF
jgi:hypothetical protein